MKIFFDFNRKRQTFLCHEMAKYWKKKYGISDYAGMVVVKDGDHLEFLKKQDEINYEFIINRDELEDKSLEKKLDLDKVKRIEEELGVPLWSLVVADRNIGHFFVKGGVTPKTHIMDRTSHENIIKWIVYHYEFFCKKIEKYKPDAVILFALASLPSLLFVKICEKKNIPYYILKSSRIKSFYSILSGNYREIDFRIIRDYRKIIDSKDFPKNISKFAINYVDSFRDKPQPPFYAESVRKKIKKSTKNFEKELFFSAIRFGKRTIFSVIKFFGGNRDKFYLRKIKSLSYLYVHVRKSLISKYLSGVIFRDKVELKEKYVFFPLHLDPEASTMVLAPNFVNQLQLIEELAKNIPIDHKLYVKEHVPCFGSRPKGFYKEIKKYPNVKLIGPWENTFNIIKNASLVAVISGTAGWEGVLMGKSVVTFSETIYSKVGLAEYCSDFNLLGKKIRKEIDLEDLNKKDKLKKVKALVTAIHKNSFEVDADSLVWGSSSSKESKKTTSKVEKIAEEFYKAFHRKK